MKRSVLFVGGCRDGEWLEIEINQNPVRMVKMPQVSIRDLCDEKAVEPCEKGFEEELYWLERLRDKSGSNYEVFLSTKEDNVIVALIEGYRRPVPEVGKSPVDSREKQNR